MKSIQKKCLTLLAFSTLPLSLMALELTQQCLDVAIQDKQKENTQYTINQNKTVTDIKTNLTWASCLYGTTGSTCTTGTPLSVNWDKAFKSTTTNLDANQTDWRLPSAIELGSLLESSCNKPAINVSIFQPILETFKSFKEYYLWSSTTDYSNPTRAYVLDVMTGQMIVKPKDISNETASFYTLIVKSK